MLNMSAAAGHQGAVPGSESPEAEVVAVPLQVHDVVPATRGAEDHQRRVRAGNDWLVRPAVTDVRPIATGVMWSLCLLVELLSLSR